MFQIYDPKMTFFDPLDDLGRTWDEHHCIQNKICSRSICISCAFGHVSEFWPQNDLFWPLRWPLMTSRCTLLESEWNLESIDMHIRCISPYFRFLTLKWPFLTPQMTSDDLKMHTIEFRRKFPIDPYAYYAYLTWYLNTRPFMTCNDLKRLIVTFWPNKMAKPNTDLESWDNFTPTHSFGFLNFSFLNFKELH